MFKSLKKFKQKKDNICARTGCNNQIKREKNGTEFNYCSSNCQMSHYSPGSSEFYDDFLESPPYNATTSSNHWTHNKDERPPSYSSFNNAPFDNENIFGSLDNVQVTPLWETEDDPPSNTSNSRYSSSKPPEDDFPLWLGSSVDPLWTPSSNKNSSRNYSPPFTPRSSSPSDEEEINCPTCTFFIRANKTVCEMCGTSITRQEPKRSYNKSSSKPKSKPKSEPKTTITSYRDLYDEEEEEEEEENDDIDDIDDILNPFEDPPPRPKRNNQSSYSSSNNYRDSLRNQSSRSYNFEDSSYSQSRNQSSRSYNFEDSSQSRNQSSRSYNFEDSSYSQSRNQSSSRNRKSSDYNSSSYQTPTPPSDKLWIEDDDFLFESVPTRKQTRQKPLPKPYTPPSFLRETSRKNVQKPPTPPIKDQITCSACNFDNRPSMTHCEICYTQLNKTPESKKTTRFNIIEETKAKRACKACSFYNDADRVQCEMCYSPIETVRKSTFNLPSFFSRDGNNKVQCPNCTFLNHPSMAQCEVCHSVLSGNDLKQQQQQYQNIIDNTPGPTTKMFPLPLDDHDYMTVQQLFKTGVPNANILAIFRMIMPAKLINAHEAFKKQTAGNNPVASVTHRMFHGTHVACDAKRYYGAPGWKFCAANNCGLCGISQNGNSCAKSKYGGQMWFASHSQTSLGYCRTDPIKAMFVQEIISPNGGAVIIVNKEAATLVKFLIIFQ